MISCRRKEKCFLPYFCICISFINNNKCDEIFSRSLTDSWIWNSFQKSSSSPILTINPKKDWFVILFPRICNGHLSPNSHHFAIGVATAWENTMKAAGDTNQLLNAVYVGVDEELNPLFSKVWCFALFFPSEVCLRCFFCLPCYHHFTLMDNLFWHSLRTEWKQLGTQITLTDIQCCVDVYYTSTQHRL